MIDLYDFVQLRRQAVIISCSLFIVLPIILCVVYKVFPLGSIGPLVLFVPIMSVFIFPPCVFIILFREHFGAILRLFIAIVSLAGGVPLAVLQMNVFAFLTWLFGIMDYQM
jgi:hypothetical protein